MSRRACLLTRDDVPQYIREIVKRLHPVLMEYEDEEGKWKCVGDIVISLETLPINSDYFDENNNNELKRLLVHGILHLNGMDHGDEHIEKGVAPVCEMLKKQEKILELLKEEKIIK